MDLPEPETPVTTVITPSGKVTSRFLRLFAFAPRKMCIRDSAYTVFEGVKPEAMEVEVLGVLHLSLIHI